MKIKDKRKGNSGRKTTLDPIVGVVAYIHTSEVEKLGGMVKAREVAKELLKEMAKKSQKKR